MNAADNYANEDRRWSRYSVVLVPRKPNGRYRQWVGHARNEDEAVSVAEFDNPGWEAYTVGPFVSWMDGREC